MTDHQRVIVIMMFQVILDRYTVEYKHAGYELSKKKYLELTSQWLKRLSEAQRDTRFKLTTLTQRFRHVIRAPAIVRSGVILNKISINFIPESSLLIY